MKCLSSVEYFWIGASQQLQRKFQLHPEIPALGKDSAESENVGDRFCVAVDCCQGRFRGQSTRFGDDAR
jgi:hypothetical protein